MGRTFGLLGIGIAIGAAATYFALADRGSPLTPIVESSVPARGLADVFKSPAALDARTETQRGTALDVAERAAFYQHVAAADVTNLKRLTRDAAALPSSPGRTFALDALLARYVEIDAADAVELGRELKLDATLLAAPYRSLAEADPRAALSALSRVDDPLQAQAIGLALLPAFGNDTRAAERIAASMASSVDREQFLVSAIGTRAHAHPAEALRDAIALTDAGQRFAAMQSVMSTWAREDPKAALAGLDELDAMLKMQLQGTALSVWGMSDPEAMLEYVTKLEPQAQRQMMLQGLQQIAAANPRRAFELADRLPPEQSGFIRQVALGSMAGRDPLAALAHADSMPLGPQRQQAYQQIAQAYGRKDADAALAWARSMRPPQPGLLSMVFMGIAQQDPMRAFDLAITIESPAEQMQALQSVVRFPGMRGDADSRAIADRIMTLADSSNRRSMLQMVASSWGTQNPKAATEWLLTHGEQVGADAFRSIASRFGQQDPAGAAAYLDRVPAEARADWMTMVAIGYSQTDPEGGLNWIRQFRGQDVYDPAAAAIASNVVQYNPRAAAELLATVDPSRADVTSAMVNVANQWATTDPYAAADWALEFDDAASRANALTGIAQAWGSYDPRAARSWALSLPSGANRDSALLGAVSSIGATESVDQTLLGAFSNERMRQQGVMRAVSSVAQRDSAEARRMIEDYISDPGMRRQAEQMVENTRTQGMINSVRGIPFGPYPAGGRPFTGQSPVGLRQSPAFVAPPPPQRAPRD